MNPADLLTFAFKPAASELVSHAGVFLQANIPDVLKTTLDTGGNGGFSFLGLFMQASLVVKIVMIGLLLASVWSWAIIVEKLFAFRTRTRRIGPLRAVVLVRPVAR